MAKKLDKPAVKIKVFEGFAGIGITRLAQMDFAEELGIEFDYVGYSEIDGGAIAAYQVLHNGDTNSYGDVTKINWKNMNVDFLSWTFPCQSISTAGNNQGFEEGSGTKSSIGFSIKKVLKEMPHKPRTIFVENVANILSPKHRATFNEFVNYLRSEGYYVSYKKIDASKVGFPQHRDRVYLLATFGYDLQFDWPKERPLDFRLRDVLESNVDPSTSYPQGSTTICLTLQRPTMENARCDYIIHPIVKEPFASPQGREIVMMIISFCSMM